MKKRLMREGEKENKETLGLSTQTWCLAPPGGHKPDVHIQIYLYFLWDTSQSFYRTDFCP